MPPESSRWAPLGRDQYVEAHTLLSGYLLCSQGDRMAMASSVEGRFPFLDHRVIEFANGLPPRYKLRVLEGKHVLREAVRGLLPERIRTRPKQPYRAPDSQSFFAQERPLDYVADLLSEKRVREGGLFDPAAVRKALREMPHRPRDRLRRQHGLRRHTFHDAGRRDVHQPAHSQPQDDPEPGRRTGGIGALSAAPRGPGMLLHQLFEATARRVPDKVALVTEAGRFTYRDLDGLASRLAASLQGAGVERGDRVAIFADNGMEAVVGIYGALKAGAVFMPVNPLTKGDKLAHLLSDSRSACLLATQVLRPVWEPALARTGSVRTCVVSGLPAADAGARLSPMRMQFDEPRALRSIARRSTRTSQASSTPPARAASPKG